MSVVHLKTTEGENFHMIIVTIQVIHTESTLKYVQCFVQCFGNVSYWLLKHVPSTSLHLQAAVHERCAFLHLQRTVMHLVVQLQEINSIQDSGTGGMVIRIGTSKFTSLCHPISSTGGRIGCVL